ncbi:serine protease [Stappia sp. MMSF_3263]|uniref:S1 family peptidase n=1 Tax=Stappia sp. MMSF_3263 TaxID=3046693 RepID=UPI00273D5CA6|nr:serine protease [Stappia sp. MMSF_3263]
MRIVTGIVSLAISLLMCVSAGLAQEAEENENEAFSAKQLVVMIDGRFPTTGKLTEGAGIVVGRKGGLVYIATAGHVVQGLTETAEDIKVQFRDRPGEEIDATPWPSNLDKGIDLAVLVVPEDRAPASITSLNEFSAARIAQEVEAGEGAYLFGQPSGKVWSGNKSPEKVVSSTSTAIEVESSSVVPGMSGGATFDEGLRIIGLIIETDNGLARIIPLKFLKEKMEEAGYPFDLVDTKISLPNVDFDPIRELTARGYQLSKNAGFLGFRGGADSEFVRALSIGRPQDAELFVQAGIKLNTDRVFSKIDVPADLTESLLKANLLSFKLSIGTAASGEKVAEANNYSDWCSRIARFELSEEQLNSDIFEYIKANNIELIKIACAAMFSDIEDSVKNASLVLEKISNQISADEANLEKYQKACVDFVNRDAPVEEIAKYIYAVAYNQKRERPDFWEMGMETLRKLRVELNSENLVFYDEDTSEFTGLFGSTGRDRGFRRLYDETHDDFYRYYSGIRLVDYMIDYKTKADVKMTDALRELLAPRVDKVCKNDVAVRSFTTAETVQYEAAQAFLQALDQ